jgi:hypothetical protein
VAVVVLLELVTMQAPGVAVVALDVLVLLLEHLEAELLIKVLLVEMVHLTLRLIRLVAVAAVRLKLGKLLILQRPVMEETAYLQVLPDLQ